MSFIRFNNSRASIFFMFKSCASTASFNCGLLPGVSSQQIWMALFVLFLVALRSSRTDCGKAIVVSVVVGYACHSRLPLVIGSVLVVDIVAVCPVMGNILSQSSASGCAGF